MSMTTACLIGLAWSLERRADLNMWAGPAQDVQSSCPIQKALLESIFVTNKCGSAALGHVPALPRAFAIKGSCSSDKCGISSALPYNTLFVYPQPKQCRCHASPPSPSYRQLNSLPPTQHHPERSPHCLPSVRSVPVHPFASGTVNLSCVPPDDAP